MKTKRNERAGSEYQKELANLIINELKDPRIPLLTSVTAVEITPDLSHAFCFISVFGKQEEKEACLEALEKAKGYLRKRLASLVKLRISPALHFKLDDSLEKGMAMDKLIAQTRAKDALISRLEADEISEEGNEPY